MTSAADRPGSEGTVYVVDDDASMRDALSSLLRSLGWQVRTFADAHDFLTHARADMPGCLVLDVCLPGISGPELQQRLTEGDDALPIVFVSAHSDIPIIVKAIKEGALEFLTKPFREQDLVSAIAQALERDVQTRRERADVAVLRSRITALSPRERQVMLLIVEGRLNKQVGAALEIAEVTVKVHRRNLMRKMGACSLPELVRMVERLHLRTA
jgi:FixJ family two-component response regulator